jgi:L-asparaginase/Glu-tRNA(Gln) amidotransferase subunit D
LPGTEIRVVPLVNKDSLEMTDSNRRLVLGAVAGLLPEDAPIVITNGTDTMVESGRFLDSVTTELRVPIILTGGWFHWDFTEATRCKTSPTVCLPLVRSVRESTW